MNSTNRLEHSYSITTKQFKSNTKRQKSILSESSENGWSARKRLNKKLGQAYIEGHVCSEGRAQAVISCAERLEIMRCAEPKRDWYKVIRSIRCGDRLCPVCGWTRARELGAQAHVMTDIVKERFPAVKWYHVVFTVRNVWSDSLKEEISAILEGYRELMQPKKRRSEINAGKWGNRSNWLLGAIRSVEVTRNNKKGDAWEGSWHPHIHMIMAVKRSFDNGRNYMNTADWQGLWRTVMKLDYFPECKIVELGTSARKLSVAEIIGYSCKPRDIVGLDETPIDEIINRALFVRSALRGRRLIQASGEVRRAWMDAARLLEAAREEREEITCCPKCGGKVEAVEQEFGGYKYVDKLGMMVDSS